MLKIQRLMRERHLQLRYLKLNITLILLFSVFILVGQTSMQVVDEEGRPLSEVSVNNLSQNIFQISDQDGMVYFDTNFNQDDIIQLNLLSYEKRQVEFSEISSQNAILVLKKSSQQLEEVILIGRSQSAKSGTLLPIESIDSKEIATLQVQTTADALERASNVFIQRSQMGGGSPIVRGFEANKVLLVIDGVRMNNAIYRSGHLQSAITIDEQILSSIDVLFGPGSILFGSDAIGGVVHFRSLEPALTESFKTEASILSRYSSANQEKTIHGNYVFSNKKYSGLLSVTYSDFDDLRAGGNRPDSYPDFGKRPDYIYGSNLPGSGIVSDSIITNDDVNRQTGSAYGQTDFSAKFKYQFNNYSKIIFNGQYSRSTNIPRYDQLIEKRSGAFRFSEWYYGPQTRLMLSPSFVFSKANGFFDEMNIITAYQAIDEDRFNRRFESTELNQNFEDLDVYSITADFRKSLSAFSLDYGVDFQYNDLRSSASNNTFTRYPNGNNSMSLFGVFAKAQIPLASKLNFDTGIRYSSSRLHVNYLQDNFFEWPDYFYDGIENNTQNFSFLSSLSLDLGLLKLSVLGGTAFRAPNIDDLAKIRINSDEIVVPNPDLKPEKTKNIELQARIGNQKHWLSASAFIIDLQDAIVRDAFSLPNGDTQFIAEGDTLNIAANINAESARVTGLSFTGSFKPIKAISLSGSISLTKGVIKNDDSTESPLGHIPPGYGRLMAVYDNDKTSQQLRFNFNLKKDINDFGGSVDNPELATPEGSLAWNTLGYYSSYYISNRMDIDIAIENIFDGHYRPFSSGISAPGRNIIFTLRARLF